MKIHQLTLLSSKDKKRVGRGIGSGYGKTAGRGTKGQNARTGGGVRPGFEGGQNPLAKRLPKKRGFVALNHIAYQVVNISRLESLKTGSKVDISALIDAGFVKSNNSPVKILGFGSLTKKLSIETNALSTSAEKAIIKAGGTVKLIEYKIPKPVKKERA
ncbi:MAG: 50S ribosomal protein L15 [Candidatus Saccharimonadia bacterium]